VPPLRFSPLHHSSEVDPLTGNFEKLTICRRCILPDTFPGISFDDQGICSHCRREEKKAARAPGRKADYRRRLDDARALAERIISQRAAGREYFCVGYDFFWQARAFSVPEYTPNMIVSSFAGQAFLDLYEIDADGKWLSLALDIGRFIEKELLLRDSGDEVVFGYIPGETTVVHNVNLLAAAYFARLSLHSGEEAHRRDSSTKQNREFMKLLQEIRTNVPLIISSTPDISLLDKDFRAFFLDAYIIALGKISVGGIIIEVSPPSIALYNAMKKKEHKRRKERFLKVINEFKRM